MTFSPGPPNQPVGAPGTTGDLPGSTVDWLYRSPRLGVALWDCAAGQRGLSEERRPFWHVVSFVHSGAFVLHAKGQPTVMDATSVLLHNPGDAFRSEHPFGHRDRGSFIGLHQEALLELLAEHDPEALTRPRALLPHPYVHGLFSVYLLQRLLVRRLQSWPSSDLLGIEETVLRVLAGVVKGARQGQGGTTARRDPSRARRCYTEDVKALLQERFRERLQLEDIARSLHVSTCHLCRTFQEQTGVPIHRYLNRLRLREAMELMTEREVDLSDLALGLGFSSHSHFTAAFRKELGIPPRGLRKLKTARIAEMAGALDL
ncbi:MAG TPA: AraC family transcriptional regulator [Thermoanaerobaculia bacterium]